MKWAFFYLLLAAILLQGCTQGSIGDSSSGDAWHCAYVSCPQSSREPAAATPQLSPEAESFLAVPGNAVVNLSWSNPVQPTFTKTRLMRSNLSHPTTPDQGTLVYEGTATTVADSGLVNNTVTYYTLFAYASGLPVSAGRKAVAVPSVPYAAQWARTTLSSDIDNQFLQITANADGSVIAAGQLKSNSTGGVSLENVTYASGVSVLTSAPGRTTAALVKYSATGTVAWAKSVANCSGESAYVAARTDSSANIYVVGYQQGAYTCDYGNGVSLTTTYVGRNPILIKYDANGNAQWARSFTPAAGEIAFTGLALDATGNLLIAGMLAGSNSLNFGNGVTLSTPSSSLTLPLILKTNASGIAVWARSATAAATDAGFLAVATDSSGNVFAAGLQAYPYAVDYGNGAAITPGAGVAENGILVKYDQAGQTQWARTIVSASDTSRFTSIAIDSAGNAYVTSEQRGHQRYQYGEGIFANGPAQSMRSGAVIKYDTAGKPLWARMHESAANETVYTSLTVAANNDIYVSGFTAGTGTVNFGNGVTASSINASGKPLLVRYANAGAAMTALTLTSGPAGSFSARYTSVTTTGSGAIFAAGYAAAGSTLGFGNGVSAVPANSRENSLIVKFQ